MNFIFNKKNLRVKKNIVFSFGFWCYLFLFLFAFLPQLLTLFGFFGQYSLRYCLDFYVSPVCKYRLAGRQCWKRMILYRRNYLRVAQFHLECFETFPKKYQCSFLFFESQHHSWKSVYLNSSGASICDFTFLQMFNENNRIIIRCCLDVLFKQFESFLLR
jgi:hypothetical protein